jgi:two-component sensor histidine kinase
MDQDQDKQTEAEAPLDQLLDNPHLADALESDRFKQFLDQVPIAIAVAEMEPEERVVYANLEFERLMGINAENLTNQPWAVLDDSGASVDDGAPLGQAVISGQDHVGTFTLSGNDGQVNIWSNVIEDDAGPVFRLVAVAPVLGTQDEGTASLQEQLAEKDTLLHELQHRVKNNLQMVTALIRLEARNMPANAGGERFETLAGRIETLAVLYRTLSGEGAGQEVDMGVYLSQIAAAVMATHATEGVRLDLKVDAWPVSIDVAMPTGLVVNELLTNALKHAFVGREGGTITLHSLVDDEGCRVIVADDGVGLDSVSDWPRRGKLSALIVQSLRQNAKADLDVVSQPGKGMRVVIRFMRANAH